MAINKNDMISGTILDLTSKGEGVLKIDRFPFFVSGTILGERVTVKVTYVGKKYGYAQVVTIDEPSPNRIALKDPIGSQIGTMTLQHMDYPAQLKYKQQQVEAAFKRIGHFEDIFVEPTIGMAYPWQYRNKAQIPVRTVNEKLETGFYLQGTHDIVPVENYYIQHPEIDRIIIIVRDILREYAMTAYDETNQTGLIRHIIVKRGHYTGQVMVILVTNGEKIPQSEAIISEISQCVPGLVSLIQNINTKNTNVILGKENRVLWGQPYYEDLMLGLTFQISAHSFYQVNTQQAETIYKKALKFAQLTGNETVLDAYCGIGTISLALAQQARKVYAMEIVPEAIQMAQQNARLNKIGNTHFEAGKAEDVLSKWKEASIHFDVAVVDPPRKGLDSRFIETLVELQPDRIVYVSCNPATQARDCRLFVDAGYRLRNIQPVDLFAQTPHVESVVLMTKRETL